MWALCWAAVAATVLGAALTVAADGPSWGLANPTLVALALLLVGTPLARRGHGRRIGSLLLGTGTVMAAAALAGGYAAQGRARGWPGADVLGWAAEEWLWAFWVVPMTTVLLALFPDGRAVSPGWRPLTWLGWSATAVLAATSATAAGPLLTGAGSLLWTCAGVAGIASLAVRWRRSDGPARDQLKHLLLAALLVLAVYSSADLLPHHLRQVAFLAVPLLLVGSVALAVLRYRLYDVDLVIRRTAVFLGVTGLVFAAYLAVAVAFGGDPSERAALVAATVVATIAEPARRRLQRATTRLLFGRRDEPLEALALLRDRLAGADSDAELVAAVTDVLPRLVRTRVVALSVLEDGLPRELGRTGTPGGPVVDLPLVHQSELLGTLTVGLREPGVPFGAADTALLEELGHQVAGAVHAVRLRRDLRAAAGRASRAVVAERARLRRELHDRLGPLLVGTGLAVEALRRGAGGDEPTAARLGEAVDQLRAASGEVRRILDELQPAVLLELGLVAAVAEHLQRLAELPGVPVIRLVGDACPDPPAAVQEAAYVTVLEAVTNVVRHAGAHEVTVRLDRDDQRLEVEVVDDGAGLGRPYVAGVGIGSMRRRALERGGSFALGPAPGGGTRLLATFPLEEAPCPRPDGPSGSSSPTTTPSSGSGSAGSSSRSTASRWSARRLTGTRPSRQPSR